MSRTPRLLEKLTSIQRHRACLLSRHIRHTFIILHSRDSHFLGLWQIACLLCRCCSISAFIHPYEKHQIVHQVCMSAFQNGKNGELEASDNLLQGEQPVRKTNVMMRRYVGSETPCYLSHIVRFVTRDRLN